jgi:hypothetical protein
VDRAAVTFKYKFCTVEAVADEDAATKDVPGGVLRLAAVIAPNKLEPPEVVATPIAKPVGVTATPAAFRLVTIKLCGKYTALLITGKT